MASRASLIRRAHFSASHRLHATRLDDAQNAEIFGKCNRLGGHGHNYHLEVEVAGPIDAVTGMVMNITDLGRIIDEVVMHRLDHYNLNEDVPEFSTKGRTLQGEDHPLVPTTENLAVWIWERLVAHPDMPAGLMREIRLHETEKNTVVYRGEE